MRIHFGGSAGHDVACCRWFVYKHSRPLSEEIVRFPPYLESDNVYRGTTVLPYLEFFYQYGTNEEAAAAALVDRGA